MRLTNQTRLSDKKTHAWLVEDIKSQPDVTLPRNSVTSG